MSILPSSTPALVSQAYVDEWESGLSDQALSASFVTGSDLTGTSDFGTSSHVFGPGESLAVTLAAGGSGSTRFFRSSVAPLGVFVVLDLEVTTFSGASAADRVMLALTNAARTHWVSIGVQNEDNRAVLQHQVAGVFTDQSFSAVGTVANGIKLRAVFTGGRTGAGTDGCWAHLYTDSGSGYAYMHSGFVSAVDVRGLAESGDLYYGFYCYARHSSAGNRVTTLAGPFVARYYGRSGAANIHAVRRQDGSEYRHADGRHYVTYTSAGRTTAFNGGSTGNTNTSLTEVSGGATTVGLWDPSDDSLEQTAILFYSDGSRSLNHSPTSLTWFDSGPYAGNWVALMSTWGTAYGTASVSTVRVETSANLLAGAHLLTGVTQPLPGTIGSLSYYDWSTVAWDGSDVRVACTLTNNLTGPSTWTYHPLIMSGTDLDNLVVELDDTSNTGYEGSRHYRYGGVDYFAFGSTSLWREYLADGTLVGTVSYNTVFTPHGIAAHPNVMLVNGALEVLTFDTAALGGMAWGHGRLVRIDGLPAVPFDSALYPWAAETLPVLSRIVNAPF